MDVCIIGLGTSGIACAIRACQRGYNVTILEKNNSPLKKLLLTGNGKCNFFNSDMSIDHYRSTNNELLKKFINETNVKKTLAFFDDLAIVSKIKNGYYYPYSNNSFAIKNLLLCGLKNKNVTIKTNTTVKDINYNGKFIIKADEENIVCDKVVISTGSNASIKNSEYNMYDIIKKLGHKIIKPLPALVMLEGKENYFNDWAGIRSEAKVSLYENDKFVASYEGEVQLTNYGISGICVMNLSSRVSRGLDSNLKEVLKINFMSEIDNVYEFIEKRSIMHPDLTIIELLESIINYKLLYVILNKNNINTDKKWNELNRKEKELLIEDLSNFSLKIVSTKGFESAQVVSGGVDLNEVSEKLESKKKSGLFFSGEVLDVDGECGGYNLGFAFISGLIVGDNI